MSDSTSPSLRCPQCGFENPLGFAFCGRCASPLTEQTPAITPIQKQPDKSEDKAERRQLTVMFCDLIGSTALSEQLDPEDLREVMLAYRDVSAKVISRYEGYIAQFLGDGLLVYFGYPVAHEDDAHRAVRTGLGIVEAIKHLNLILEQERGVKLAVRIGIHTGLVVAGDMGTGEQLQARAIVGETPNVAARVQSLAETDSVIISQSTHRLVQGYFDCWSKGGHTLKGISKPVEVYQVLAESTAKTRLDVAAAAGFTPLVGREKELQSLTACWEQAKEGRGQVALLSGEAGIGKSRLVHKLKEQVAQELGAWLTPCQCLSYYQNSALYPIIDLLERLVLGFEREDTSQQKLSKLEGWLVQYGFSLLETMPLFASLLSIPLGDNYAPLNLAPEQLKQKTFQALLAVLLKRATLQPLLFVMEDLHWADSSTLELITLLIDQTPAARIFLLVTFRPEFTPPWAMRSYVSHFTLHRLPHQQTKTMIERLTHGKALPIEVLKELVVKTDGVPLFVEELTKMILESGLLKEESDRYELVGPLPPLSIPTTLQDSLLARLDKLATVKDVLQLAATIGQEFTYDLLRAVSSLDDVTLQHELSQLVGAELLYQSSFPPEARYVFKHALIRDSAYQQQLRSKRQISHQRIAQVLEKEFSNTVETQPELVAYHYTEAGLMEQAISYWLKAGRRAMERSANVEAISHLTKGIELLKKFEETPEHMQQELEFQITLGPALMNYYGHSHPIVAETYARAAKLGQETQQVDTVFRVLWGLCANAFVGGKLSSAEMIVKQLFNTAEQTGSSLHRLEAYHAGWTTAIWQGATRKAEEYFNDGMPIYNREQFHQACVSLQGHDTATCGQALGTMNLWLYGYPDGARNRAKSGYDLAIELHHPFSLAFGFLAQSIIGLLTRDVTQLEQWTEEFLNYSYKNKYGFFMVTSGITQGWYLARTGRFREAVQQMVKTTEVMHQTKAYSPRPLLVSTFMDVYRMADQINEAIQIFQKELEEHPLTGQRFMESEIRRLYGELLLAKDNPQQADQEFQLALNIARKQEAKSLELRAGMSLARLWHSQKRTQEACQMLSEIYNWFTEGFETADLKEAKVLLETLS